MNQPSKKNSGNKSQFENASSASPAVLSLSDVDGIVDKNSPNDVMKDQYMPDEKKLMNEIEDDLDNLDDDRSAFLKSPSTNHKNAGDQIGLSSPLLSNPTVGGQSKSSSSISPLSDNGRFQIGGANGGGGGIASASPPLVPKQTKTSQSSLSFFPSFSPPPTSSSMSGGDMRNDIPPGGDTVRFISSYPIDIHSSSSFNTLDEPISDTIKRDLLNIWKKLKIVLQPSVDRSNVLQDWDLWGPLLLCLTLALSLTLSIRSGSEPASLFTLVFVLVWFGSAIVTINSKLLGGPISFFQSVCVLGYCMFPLVVSSIVCVIIRLGALFRLIAVMPALAWSVYASLGFLADNTPINKRLLAIYPIFLFYFVMSWIIIIS